MNTHETQPLPLSPKDLRSPLILQGRRIGLAAAASMMALSGLATLILRFRPGLALSATESCRIGCGLLVACIVLRLVRRASVSGRGTAALGACLAFVYVGDSAPFLPASVEGFAVPAAAVVLLVLGVLIARDEAMCRLVIDAHGISEQRAWPMPRRTAIGWEEVDSVTVEVARYESLSLGESQPKDVDTDIHLEVRSASKRMTLATPRYDFWAPVPGSDLVSFLVGPLVEWLRPPCIDRTLTAIREQGRADLGSLVLDRGGFWWRPSRVRRVRRFSDAGLKLGVMTIGAWFLIGEVLSFVWHSVKRLRPTRYVSWAQLASVEVGDGSLCVRTTTGGHIRVPVGAVPNGPYLPEILERMATLGVIDARG